jgi:HEAT repeat protein
MGMTLRIIEEMHESNDVLGLLNATHKRNPEKPPDNLYWAIEDALIDIGHRDITPFIELINDKDLRRLVFWVLMKIKDINTIDLLISAINDKDENVRHLAVHTLGEFGEERALIPLSNLLVKNNPLFKEEVSLAIESIQTRIN